MVSKPLDRPALLRHVLALVAITGRSRQNLDCPLPLDCHRSELRRRTHEVSSEEAPRNARVNNRRPLFLLTNGLATSRAEPHIPGLIPPPKAEPVFGELPLHICLGSLRPDLNRVALRARQQRTGQELLRGDRHGRSARRALDRFGALGGDVLRHRRSCPLRFRGTPTHRNDYQTPGTEPEAGVARGAPSSCSRILLA